MSKEVKVALIGGTCVIIAAIIGVFSYDLNKTNKTLTLENTELFKENSDWESAYNNLQQDFNELSNKNASLSSEVDSLKKSMEKYADLVDENESLKGEVSKLEDEIQSLTKPDSQKMREENDVEDITSDHNGKKVSIFNLTTFRGKAGWNRATFNLDYTDTYDNQYPNAYIASHYATTIEDGYYVPIYLLDNKYSICEGQIAWSKSSKDLDGSAWIEFYSGDELIYTTDPITADSKVLTFSFNVEGVEKLTILRNGTRSDYIAYDTAYMVYPYFNLIE